MTLISERSPETVKYDPLRALKLKTQISRRLTAMLQSGEIDLLYIQGKLATSDKPETGHTTFMVANRSLDPHPISDPSILDNFRRDLTDPLSPDQEISSSRKSGLAEGLWYGSSEFDSVPGFVVSDGEVIPDPQRQVSYLRDMENAEALSRLSEETGTDPIDLVHRTSIRVFPDPELMLFLYEYYQGVRQQHLPYSHYIEPMFDRLSAEQLQTYIPNPKNFAALQRDHLKYLIKLGSVGLNRLR